MSGDCVSTAVIGCPERTSDSNEYRKGPRKLQVGTSTVIGSGGTRGDADTELTGWIYDQLCSA